MFEHELLSQELNESLKTLLRGGVGFVRMAEETRLDPSFLASEASETMRSREKRGRAELERVIRFNLHQAKVPESSIVITASHTSSADGSCVVVAGSDEHVGVDLEASSRKVHPKILTRITSSGERDLLGHLKHLEKDTLKFWVIKEAAFKSNPHNLGTTLPDYVLSQWDPFVQEGSVLLPRQSEGYLKEWGCRVKFLELGTWYLALAHTFRKKNEG